MGQYIRFKRIGTLFLFGFFVFLLSGCTTELEREFNTMMYEVWDYDQKQESYSVVTDSSIEIIGKSLDFEYSQELHSEVYFSKQNDYYYTVFTLSVFIYIL